MRQYASAKCKCFFASLPPNCHWTLRFTCRDSRAYPTAVCIIWWEIDTWPDAQSRSAFVGCSCHSKSARDAAFHFLAKRESLNRMWGVIVILASVPRWLEIRHIDRKDEAALIIDHSASNCTTADQVLQFRYCRLDCRKTWLLSATHVGNSPTWISQ